jgi:hypothetical protein
VPSRRDFLHSAAVISATPLAGQAVFAAGREPVALDGVVYDRRHPESRSFAGRAASFGSPIRAIEGDITDLWQHELLARWKGAPAAIAGLTERPALFVLERLAWDHGLRVVFEAEHVPDTGSFGVFAEHRLVRTANPGLALDLGAAGPSWPVALADRLFSGSRVTTRDFTPSGAALAAHREEPTKLYSWIIAPRSAA